jgi:hypothetical protein
MTPTLIHYARCLWRFAGKPRRQASSSLARTSPTTTATHVRIKKTGCSNVRYTEVTENRSARTWRAESEESAVTVSQRLSRMSRMLSCDNGVSKKNSRTKVSAAVAICTKRAKLFASGKGPASRRDRRLVRCRWLPCAALRTGDSWPRRAKPGNRRGPAPDGETINPIHSDPYHRCG